MRKHFSKAAFVAAVSFVVFGGFVCTSCSEQQAIAPEPVKVIETKYVNTETEVERIIDNVLVAQTLKDRVEILYNGQSVMTASVDPDSLTMILPVAQHTTSTIKGADNRWVDSHGMGFTGVISQTKREGLELTASIVPTSPFSTTKNIHEKVTMLDGSFELTGMATLSETGKSNTFSIPVPSGMYFMCDTSVAVRTITEKEIQIEYRDSIVYQDSIVYVDRVEKIEINHNSNEIMVSGLGFADIFFSVDDAWLKWHVALDSTFIGRSEENFGKAKVTSSAQTGFTADDSQKGLYNNEASGMNATVTTNGIGFTAVSGDNSLKMGTVSIDVKVSFTNTKGESDSRTFSPAPFYFHKLIVKAEPSVVVPPVTTEHVYDVDTVRVDVKDSEGNLTGQKMRVTIKRDGEVVFKGQYMACEWGLMTATLTGTQVGEAKMLRSTTVTPEAYNAEGWSGTEDLKGATLTATAKQFKFRTAFPAVPGFGASEESVAESNIVFGTRNFYWKDAETDWSLTITEGEMNVKVVIDEVDFNEAAKAEVNGRGLQYEYIGSHKLSIEQYVGSTLVNTQSREEYLLYPKN